MTGFGTAQRETSAGVLFAEVKSLNSRGLELGTRLPRALADRDLGLRALLTRALQRGKISLTVELLPVGAGPAAEAAPPRLLDLPRLTQVVRELTEAAAMLGVPLTNPLALALSLPGVVRRADPVDADDPVAAQAQAAELAEALEPVVQEAIARLDEHRRTEGAALEAEFRGYGLRLRELLAEVTLHDPSRVAAVRTRLEQHLGELALPDSFDAGRFEQELLYYIEKLDIEEEKVRLTSHLDYYDSLLTDPEPAGKKLGFLAQEIGREINTIGSKANDAALQHLVVAMKEELEKIKEQVNNVL